MSIYNKYRLLVVLSSIFFFFFNDTATTEIYTLSLHDALPICGGAQVHVTDRKRFPAFLAYLLLIHHARRQSPKAFAWRDPPYEYEYLKRPIDILCGNDRIRRTLDEGRSPRTLAPGWRREAAAFRRRRARHLLY